MITTILVVIVIVIVGIFSVQNAPPVSISLPASLRGIPQFAHGSPWKRVRPRGGIATSANGAT